MSKYFPASIQKMTVRKAVSKTVSKTIITEKGSAAA